MNIKKNILCYDCKKYSESNFHFDYIKCLECNHIIQQLNNK